MTNISLPEHFIDGRGVNVIVGSAFLYIAFSSSEGKYTQFTIDDVSKVLDLVQKLLRFNEIRGLKLENLVGKWDYEKPENFWHTIKVHKNDVGLESVVFDYASYVGTSDELYVDRVSYAILGLHENLERPMNDIERLYPVKKKDHQIGGGVFA